MTKMLAGLVVAIALIPLAVRAESAPEARLITVKIKVADFDKTADFYKRVLGMEETFHNPAQAGKKDGAELGLNFGRTVEAAKANTGPTVVLVQSRALPKKSADGVAPIVLAVAEIDAAIKRVADFGAPVARSKKPLPPPYGGFVFMAYDPSGNVIEFIELPK